MARFFFHLHECDGVTIDDEGLDLPDLAAAQHHAEAAARDIMGSEVVDGELCLARHIEIENCDDGARTTVAFRDAVRITD